MSVSLGSYALTEASAIEQITTRLNEHGFALEHSASELLPRLEYLAIFLRQPLMAAALPWALRRILARPYKKR